VGNWNVGSLLVRQDEDAASRVDAQSVFVGRAARNVLTESQVGFIVTDGDPQANLDNSLVGTDFRYRNSRMPGGRVLEGEAWYQQSDTPGLSGDEGSYGFGVAAPNSNGWRGGYSYKVVDYNFNPGLGFVNQRGIEDHALDAGVRTFLTPGSYMRSWYAGFDGYRNSDLDSGDLISETLQLRANANNNTNDVVTATLARRREVLVRPFTIYRASDGLRTVVIPVGDYSFTQSGVSLTTAGQREWAGRIGFTTGDYYGGESVQGNVNVTWQPRRGWNLQAGYSEQRIELPQGNFTVRQLSFNAMINFTADLTWTNRLQYDNVSEGMGINSRLYWIPEPGREMYVVLNWGLADPDKDNSFVSTYNDLTLKYNDTFRF
jgi:hypothetical protein